MESQARVMELATGKVCDLNAPAMEHTGIALIDEGTLVLVGTDMKTHGINEDPFVYALDLGDDPLETGGSNFRRISRDDFDVGLLQRRWLRLSPRSRPVHARRGR